MNRDLLHTQEIFLNQARQLEKSRLEFRLLSPICRYSLMGGCGVTCHTVVIWISNFVEMMNRPWSTSHTRNIFEPGTPGLQTRYLDLPTEAEFAETPYMRYILYVHVAVTIARSPGRFDRCVVHSVAGNCETSSLSYQMNFKICTHGNDTFIHFPHTKYFRTRHTRSRNQVHTDTTIQGRRPGTAGTR